VFQVHCGLSLVMTKSPACHCPLLFSFWGSKIKFLQDMDNGSPSKFPHMIHIIAAPWKSSNKSLTLHQPPTKRRLKSLHSRYLVHLSSIFTGTNPACRRCPTGRNMSHKLQSFCWAVKLCSCFLRCCVCHPVVLWMKSILFNVVLHIFSLQWHNVKQDTLAGLFVAGDLWPWKQVRLPAPRSSSQHLSEFPKLVAFFG